MKKQTKRQTGIIVLLAIVVLLMTIGFAAYQSNLKINWTVTVSPTSWDVHYIPDDITEATGSVAATSATIGADSGAPDNTKFTFSVTLPAPGSFYEATINAKNFGTITAYLNKVTMSSLTTEQSKYLTYKIIYNGTEYSSTTDGINNVSLASTASHPVKIRIDYILPESASDLPSTQQEVTVSGQLDYSNVD